MKKISEVANIIPVIAKADSLTMEERTAFKRRIKEEIDFHGIRIFPYMDIPTDEDFAVANFGGVNGATPAGVAPAVSEAERAERQLAQSIRDMIPFAVVGSERNIVVDGKAVRGRRTRWGLINSEYIIYQYLACFVLVGWFTKSCI
jgi:septin 3/9/12